MKKKFRIRVVSGNHREGGKTYRPGDIFLSDRPWHKLVAERFELAPRAVAPPDSDADDPGQEGGESGDAPGAGDDQSGDQPDQPGDADAGDADDPPRTDDPPRPVFQKTHRGGGYWDVHDGTGSVHAEGSGLKRAAADALIEKLNGE